MFKKALFGIAVGIALPFAVPSIRRGFAEGFMGEWRKAFPDGVHEYYKQEKLKKV